MDMDDDIPYLLLTPGPLTTSKSVKQAMLRDYCTWDDDYHQVVNEIRERLVALVDGAPDYCAVLMQGSGTFAVEATLGSVIGPRDKVLVVDNGAYGDRMVRICERLGIFHTVAKWPETSPAAVPEIERRLRDDAAISHVAMVHCETTTGLLNPATAVGQLARSYGKIYILDAMSSLGGLPLKANDVGAHYLIASSNKCIQGVPGFGFVIAHRATFEATRGWARSLSLDLYDQWREMEQGGGKWRYTSPTHVVRAFLQALLELDAEGGVEARYLRYVENHRRLVDGLQEIGLETLIKRQDQSPIITSFLYPQDDRFTFAEFYQRMKQRRFVLYPGKISQANTFRIGTIGHVFPDDIRELVRCVRDVLREMGIAPSV
jgi:2-aminoethylphosphonate-pyruvate transaminase